MEKKHYNLIIILLTIAVIVLFIIAISGKATPTGNGIFDFLKKKSKKIQTSSHERTTDENGVETVIIRLGASDYREFIKAREAYLAGGGGGTKKDPCEGIDWKESCSCDTTNTMQYGSKGCRCCPIATK